MRSLIEKIESKRELYAQAKTKLAEFRNQKPAGIVYDDTSVLDFSDEEWSKVQMGIVQSAQLILAQGIHPGLPRENLENVINLHLQRSQSLVPKDSKSWATKLLGSVLQANLKKDEQQTELQASQEAAKIPPEMVTVK